MSEEGVVLGAVFGGLLIGPAVFLVAQVLLFGATAEDSVSTANLFIVVGALLGTLFGGLVGGIVAGRWAKAKQ